MSPSPPRSRCASRAWPSSCWAIPRRCGSATPPSGCWCTGPLNPSQASSTRPSRCWGLGSSSSPTGCTPTPASPTSGRSARWQTSRSTSCPKSPRTRRESSPARPTSWCRRSTGQSRWAWGRRRLRPRHPRCSSAGPWRRSPWPCRTSSTPISTTTAGYAWEWPSKGRWARRAGRSSTPGRPPHRSTNPRTRPRPGAASSPRRSAPARCTTWPWTPAGSLRPRCNSTARS